MFNDHSRPEETALRAALDGLAVAAAAALAWQAAAPKEIAFAGMTIDRLSAPLATLVGVVGAAALRFSLRYMDGEPRKRHFLRLLFLTVCCAYLLMLSTSLPLLLFAWTLTGLGLHGLLTFYRDRPDALPPARKKFLVSRLGDAALIAAIVLIWRQFGSLDLHEVLRRSAATAGDSGGSVDAIAVLIAIAALTKSAQFPFHSWLPETMEAPTPVSGLMHAGVINAGGAVLIRFSPLIARSTPAMCLLVVVGTLTAALGMVSMWAQVKIKRTLAWSTVGQMGFMMVECGLGAFPAATLHIIGHGFYKAWSFLRSGALPPAAPPPPPPRPMRTLLLAGIGTLAAIPAIALATNLTGLDPRGSPGEMALAGILALSVGQLWAALLAGVEERALVARRLALAVALTPAAAIVAMGLYQGAAGFLAPVLGPIPPPTNPAAWAVAALPVCVFAALVVMHAMLPMLGRADGGRALRVHALNGFYFGAIADLFVARIWESLSGKDAANA